MDRTDELLGKVEEKVRCLERLFQATDLAMVVTDLENMILYINKNFSSILRIPDDQLIGENLFKFLEIINIDDEAFWKGLLSKIHRKEPLEGVKYKVKERIFQIDGSIVECEEDKEAIFWVWRDITSEERKARKDQHINAVLNASRIIVRTVAKEDNPSVLIRKLCHILVETGSYSRAWLLLLDTSGSFTEFASAGFGKNFSELINMLRQNEFPFCVQKALQQDDPFIVEAYVSECETCPLHSELQGNASMSMKLEYNERIYGTLTVHLPADLGFEQDEMLLLQEITSDISLLLHSIEIEQQLRSSILRHEESEAKFRLLVEKLPFGLSIARGDKTFEYLNPKFTQITGYTINDVPDKKSWLLKAYPDAEYRQKMLREWKKTLDSTTRAGKPSEGIFTVTCKNGKERELRFTSVALDTGETICTCEDLTERRSLQLQLQQAQKMEAIGRLAGGIAHDFNNLLTTIMGTADLMCLYLPKEHPFIKELKEIRKAAKRASDLTRQLLAFSKKQILQPRVINLNDTVRDMGKLLRRLIGEDIELVEILDENLGNINADKAQIEQVIMNLAVNARDAMPNGGKLTIETANVELDEVYARSHASVTPGSYVLLAITDTGHGIDKETQSYIFEPFFTTKEEKGTGLGLAMVYGIVKQSNGHIWVYSELWKGTTFKIYLPRVEEEVTTAEVEFASVEGLTGNETVLLVEDDNLVRNLTARILEEAGYTVLSASYGEEALSLARESKRIDLLITDVVMPRMSGRKLAAEFIKIHPESKVIYMSGYTDNSIVNNGILEPGVVFVQKPFSREVLLKKIRQVLQ
ncbi:MAG: hypothetical protein DRG59_10770 [Deltaproteobacteria bacterium]|nr:MAG: hypothetical protein DRG59_10770 [Deltaproteobacteria bacterium]